MKLTAKLISHLNRVFDKASRPVLALRVNADSGVLNWSVADGVLQIQYGAIVTADLTVNLADYTVASLATYLAGVAGLTVPFVDDTGTVAGLSARVLVDGSGEQAESNGDHLYAYTSVLWAWMEPIAAELRDASAAIDEMVKQMVPQTAAGEWLDQLGAYYSVDRNTGELDVDYALRIVASVGKPTGNNVAIEQAINTVVGGLQARVVDAAAMAYTGGTSYGLFDVTYDIDLEGTDDLNAYTSRVVAIVEALRHAGTHMKSIAIVGTLADTYDTATRASDSISALNIDMSSMADSAALNIRHHDGRYRRDGSFINYWNGSTTFDGSYVYGWNSGPLVLFDSGNEELRLTVTVSGVAQPEEVI